MTEEIRAVCGEREADAFGGFCDWLDASTSLEMPRFIERSFDAPLDLAEPLRPGDGPGAARWPPPAGEGRRGALRRRTAAAHLQLPGDVRRARALRGARDLRGDHLHGHRQRRVRPERRHARAAGGPGHGRRTGRRHVPLRHAPSIGSCSREGTRGPVTGVRLAGGEVVEAEAVVANPDLPVVYRTLLPGTAGAAGGPARPLLALGPRVARRRARASCPEGTEHHNIHFGHAWDGAFRAILRDGVRMPDPSLLVSVPSLHEPSMAPAGCTRSTCSSRPRTSTVGSTGWTPGARPATTCRPPRAPRLPDRHRGRGARRSARLGGAGDGARHAVRAVAPVPPDRSVPARQPRAPGAGPRVHGSGTVPGVGVPMVLVSGMLAAQRVEAMGHDDRHPRRELRPLPGAQQALRHHLLLVDVRAAPREAPPRVGALRLLPARRRHRRRPRPGRRSRSARRR